MASHAARTLYERGDADGAANRAYYAVFGAARAALASVRASLAQSKKHVTILRRFQKHFVQGRGFSADLGRPFLSRQMTYRHLADYGEMPVDAGVACSMVGEMERFLAEVGPLVKESKQ